MTIETPEYVRGFNSGLREAEKHQVNPSKNTIKMFKGMENKINDLQKETKEISKETIEQGKDIEHIKESQVRVEKKLDGFIQKADDCYAGKYVETEIIDIKKTTSSRTWQILSFLMITLVGIILVALNLK